MFTRLLVKPGDPAGPSVGIFRAIARTFATGEGLMQEDLQFSMFFYMTTAEGGLIFGDEMSLTEDSFLLRG